jgi:hypothetical protein
MNTRKRKQFHEVVNLWRSEELGVGVAGVRELRWLRPGRLESSEPMGSGESD